MLESFYRNPRLCFGPAEFKAPARCEGKALAVGASECCPVCLHQLNGTEQLAKLKITSDRLAVPQAALSLQTCPSLNLCIIFSQTE